MGIGGSMDTAVGRDQFWEIFKGRTVVVSQLPVGHSRALAAAASARAGRDGASLRTKAEYQALYGLLLAQVPPTPAEKLRLLDEAGRPTAAASAIKDYIGASLGKPEFFGADMYMFHVTGFRPGRGVLTEPTRPACGARVDVWKTDPSDRRRIPSPGGGGVLFSTQAFTLKNSGNRTLRAPKPSWRIILDAAGHGNRLAGMTRINLKAMYNDPSQMREALAWRLFGIAGVPAPRHTYAKLAFDATYRGLFSVIEHVDKKFLADHFGENHLGNLYKTGCRDLGCASLTYRTGPGGDDSGSQYFIPGAPERTYRLQTNKNNPEASTYDDLACFIRTINGIGLRGGDERFDTDAFRESVDGIMNVNAFLRWAAVNMLLGSWDNYYATPSNYYLYNSGRSGAAEDFVGSPYFHFIPWDYDNCLGIDYSGTQWQYADILDWPGKVNRHIPKIPLVRNVLRNHDYRQYYLDYMEHMLDTEFNPRAIIAQIGSRTQDGLWHRVRQAAYLESDTPDGRPFTGRRYSNDEVYQSGCRQRELRHGKKTIEGIVHYVRMRHDSARAQLKRERRTMPRAADGFLREVDRPPRAA
jgi:CotH kinase protein